MGTIIGKMRREAQAIFHAGLRAVEPAAAVKRALRRYGNRLFIGDRIVDLADFENLYIIGAGKASGPTVADRSRFSDGMAIIEKYGILNQLPGAVTAHVTAGVSGKTPETPKPGDVCFEKSQRTGTPSSGRALWGCLPGTIF